MHCDVTWKLPFWNEEYSRKHRAQGERAKSDWDSSLLTRGTADLQSKYSPYLSRDEIQTMEMECLDPSVGTEIVLEICHLRRYYRCMDKEIGASEGQKTPYIVVQHNSTGDVHGYPITANRLRKLGAKP